MENIIVTTKKRLKNGVWKKENKFSGVPKTKHYFENSKISDNMKTENEEIFILYDGENANVFHEKIITKYNYGKITKIVKLKFPKMEIEIENCETEIDIEKEFICENTKISYNDLLKICILNHIRLYHAKRIVKE